jgi:hypothetical protein
MFWEIIYQLWYPEEPGFHPGIKNYDETGVDKPDECKYVLVSNFENRGILIVV